MTENTENTESCGIEEVAFALSGVGVNFGAVKALEDVSARIVRGELVALVGPSGGGKTTFLRVLNGMVMPGRGRVLSLGRELATAPAEDVRRVRSRLALIPQELGLVPGYRVVQNVFAGRFGRRSLAGSMRDLLWPAAPDLDRVHALLERVGIGEKMYQRTEHLSGGQRQRVAIARALFQEPEALLADEPLSSVDPARAVDLVGLLTSLAREEGWTLVMSLHNLELARQYFPRLIGLRGGRVVFDSPAEGLSDDAFAKLYDLSDRELLEDGGEGGRK